MSNGTYTQERSCSIPLGMPDNERKYFAASYAVFVCSVEGKKNVYVVSLLSRIRTGYIAWLYLLNGHVRIEFNLLLLSI